MTLLVTGTLLACGFQLLVIGLGRALRPIEMPPIPEKYRDMNLCNMEFDPRVVVPRTVYR